MDDKTLLQSLINEIKNLNARGVTDSKVLRDSLSQDSLISQGITDLNKKFEKSSKDNKQILDDSKSVLEEIRDEIKNNSGGNQGGGIVQAANLQNLSTLFFKMIDSTKDLIAINTQLNKNIEDLIKSNNGLLGLNISRPNPTALNTTQPQTTATTTDTKDSQTLLQKYNDAAQALGSFIGAINSIKIIPALKASFFLPMIVGNMVKAMKKFAEGDFFGKLRQVKEDTKEGEKTISKTFDYSSNLFESLKKFAESLQIIQGMKVVKTWVQIKLLSMFIIPSMIKAINKFGDVKEETANKIEKIGESIAKFLEPFSKFMDSFKNMGIGFLALAGGILAIVGAVWLISLIKEEDLIKGGAAILTFLAATAIMSKFSVSSYKTSLTLLALGAAMIPFAYGLSLLKDIKPEIIDMVGASLIGLIGILTLAGNFLTNPATLAGIAAVVIAIAAIGGSLMLLGKAANLFNAVDPAKLGLVALSMLGLSLSILPLVPFAPFVGILSISMAVLAATLMALSKVGLQLEPVTNFFNDFKSFIKEIEISKILGLSVAIGTLGLAIGAFAASNFSVGISDAFSGIIGFFTGEKSIIEKLKELSSLTGLSAVGMGVKDLAEGMNMLAQIQSGSFAGFNEFPWDKVKEISKELQDGATLQIIPVLNANSLNSQKLETTGASMSGGSQVIVTNVTNNGGNVSNTNVSNSSRNVRMAPSIETGSALAY